MKASSAQKSTTLQKISTFLAFLWNVLLIVALEPPYIWKQLLQQLQYILLSLIGSYETVVIFLLEIVWLECIDNAVVYRDCDSDGVVWCCLAAVKIDSLLKVCKKLVVNFWNWKEGDAKVKDRIFWLSLQLIQLPHPDNPIKIFWNFTFYPNISLALSGIISHF